MRPILLAGLLAASWLAFPAPSSAQLPPPDTTLRAEKLAEGLYVLFGSGGNMALSVGADARFLVDDQFAPMTPAIQKAVADLGAPPVRFVPSTHWHGDHTGGNENLGAAGAVIVAHDELATRGLRVATVLVYLSYDYDGGETDFPLLPWRYRGRTGDAVVFRNVTADCTPDRRMLHAGRPPSRGEKWLLSKWVRDRPQDVRDRG